MLAIAKELFLASQKIMPKVLLDNDFKFQFITIESAFKENLAN